MKIEEEPLDPYIVYLMSQVSEDNDKQKKELASMLPEVANLDMINRMREISGKKPLSVWQRLRMWWAG